MNDLEKISIQRIKQLAASAESKIYKIPLAVKDKEFDAEKHTYPIASELRELIRLVDAVLNNK